MHAPELHVVVPAGIDDPARPSGGNRYDRQVIGALAGLGHAVRELRVAHPDEGDQLAGVLAGLPEGAAVVVDGLVATAVPDAVVAAAHRLRVVVLLHMPFAEAFPDVRRAERAVLEAASGVVTTSDWARDWVLRHHGLAPERVRVAAPGVDPAPVTAPSAGGGRLLSLGAVTRDKGHDVLLSALAELADLEWTWTCAGALDLEPDFVGGLHELAIRSGIGTRVRFTGPLSGDPLRSALGETDLLVSASRHEAYGMAVTEALARGVPAVVTDVGGHPEALGGAGVVVPPDDPDRLAAALRRWLESPEERDRLRAAATERRAALTPWETTARRIAEVVDTMAGRTSLPPTPDTTGARR